MVAKKILATILVVALLMFSIVLSGCGSQVSYTQDELNTKVDEAKSTAVGPLESQISTLKVDISDKNAKIASLEKDVADSKSTAVATVDNTAALESLKADKAAVETKLADLQKQLDSRSGKVIVELSNADLDNGALIKSTGKDLNLGDDVATVLSKITDKELPVLLADGVIVSEDSNDEFDYEQYIEFDSGAEVKFDRLSDLGDEKTPTVYLDTSASTGVYDVVVEFSDAVDFTELSGSETIKIAGKEYTVKPGLSATGNLVLLGNEETVLLNLGEKKTIAGVDYELIGANADISNAILKVGVSQKTITEGLSYVIAGQEVYVKSLYITNIPTTSAQVEIFVGSQEMEIKQSTTSTPDTLRINDVTVKGVTAYVDNISKAKEIKFRVTPVETDDDANKYLEVGTKFVDPVFGLNLEFSGMSEALVADSKAEVTLDVSGDVVSLKFTNYNEDVYNLDVCEYNGSEIVTAENFVMNKSDVKEDDYFIVSDNDKITFIYKVVDFNEEDTKNTSTIEDVATGKEYVLIGGNNVGESDVTVISITKDTLKLSEPTSDKLYTENNGLINIVDSKNIEFLEDSKAIDESVNMKTLSIVIGLEDVDKIRIDEVTMDGTYTAFAPDKAGDIEYTLSQFGTYVEFDKEDGSYLNLYYPKDSETKYYVSVSASDASVVKQTKEYAIGDVLAGFGTIKSIN